MIKIASKNSTKPLELIVLSSCKSSKGDNRSVLGLAGLAVRAGSKSVLAAAWKVDDAPTTEFMTQFYKGLSIPGTTKAKAVLLAQKSMRDEGRAPQEWGAYTLVGSWL
jgi:CHAT domain-containing protein